MEPRGFGGEVDVRPGCRRGVVGRLAGDHHGAVAEPADDVTFVAERFHDDDLGREDAVRPEQHVLGPDADHDVGDVALPRARAASSAGSATTAPGKETAGAPSAPGTTLPGTVFIGGVPMKLATNRFAGRVVDLLRRPDLLEHTVAHDRDAMAHRHRLDLVVRDVDHRRLEPALQLDELGTRLHAQRRVEVGERLVHQERLRAAHDRPRERDALPLSAGELRGLALHQLTEPEGFGRGAHQLLALGRRQLAALQRELDVPLHGHVRVQRVALEHHRDVAILGLDVVDDAIADADVAVRRILEPRDHPEGGGLPAARRPEKHEEFVVLGLEIEVAHRNDIPEALRHMVEHDPSHRDVRLRAKEPALGVPSAQRRDFFRAGWRQFDDTFGDDEIPPARGACHIDPRPECIGARRHRRQHQFTVALLERAQIGDERAHRRARRRDVPATLRRARRRQRRDDHAFGRGARDVVAATGTDEERFRRNLRGVDVADPVDLRAAETTDRRRSRPTDERAEHRSARRTASSRSGSCGG